MNLHLFSLSALLALPLVACSAPDSPQSTAAEAPAAQQADAPATAEKSPAAQSAATAPVVSLEKLPQGGWQLLKNGEPYEIKGVGRTTNLDMAVEIGANTVRTYLSPIDGRKAAALGAMDEAHKRGLSVIRGIYLNREGNNFSYSNPEDLERQRQVVRETVRAYKDHPALLIWAVGNEAEGPRTREVHPEFWKELGVLASIVKEEDPGRPVMSVVTGTSAWRMQALKEYCPDVDIIGINTYSSARVLPERLDTGGWEGPYILTEFGPRGHWEVRKTGWGAPIEPDSEAKASLYSAGYAGASADPKNRFLGAVCFVWAQKQEVTSSWYGMFLESGEKTPAVDAMAHAYTGQWPQNRSPEIVSLTSELNRKSVAPGAEFTASVVANNRSGEAGALEYEWRVVRESGVKWAEGENEPVPPTIEGLFEQGQGSDTVRLRTPEVPSAYRLFVYVRDGKGGGAVQNIPFLVVADEIN